MSEVVCHCIHPCQVESIRYLSVPTNPLIAILFPRNTSDEARPISLLHCQFMSLHVLFNVYIVLRQTHKVEGIVAAPSIRLVELWS